LKSADNRLIRPLQNFNDSPLATHSLPVSVLRGYAISNDPRDHPILVHRRALILGSNVQIPPAVPGFVDDITKPLWIHLKRTDDQVGFFGQNVTIFSDPGDLSSSFEIVQDLLKAGLSLD
jgi:hypothetical protein